MIVLVNVPAEERRVVDAVHHDEELVEREPAAHAAAHAAGEHEPVVDLPHPRVEAARRLATSVCRCAKSLSRQARVSTIEVAGRVARAPRAEEEVILDVEPVVTGL